MRTIDHEIKYSNLKQITSGKEIHIKSHGDLTGNFFVVPKDKKIYQSGTLGYIGFRNMDDEFKPIGKNVTGYYEYSLCPEIRISGGPAGDDNIEYIEIKIIDSGIINNYKIIDLHLSYLSLILKELKPKVIYTYTCKTFDGKYPVWIINNCMGYLPYKVIVNNKERNRKSIMGNFYNISEYKDRHSNNIGNQLDYIEDQFKNVNFLEFSKAFVSNFRKFNNVEENEATMINLELKKIENSDNNVLSEDPEILGKLYDKISELEKELESEKDKLISERDKLKSEKNKLISERDELQSELDKLKYDSVNNHDNIMKIYGILSNTHDTIMKIYSKLDINNKEGRINTEFITKNAKIEKEINDTRKEINDIIGKIEEEVMNKLKENNNYIKIWYSMFYKHVCKYFLSNKDDVFYLTYLQELLEPNFVEPENLKNIYTKEIENVKDDNFYSRIKYTDVESEIERDEKFRKNLQYNIHGMIPCIVVILNNILGKNGIFDFSKLPRWTPSNYDKINEVMMFLKGRLIK